MCKEVKPLADFNKDKKGRDGHGYRCKPCANSRASSNYFENHEVRKEKNRAYGKQPKVRVRTRELHFHARYGITIEDYDRLLATQDGVCAICRTKCRDVREREWTVDHDHTTNEVRGILGDKCNRILGLFKDDPDVIDAAIKYLIFWAKAQL
jgi:hypothetical protein